MGVTNSNKVADTAAICCGDSFKVTLALTAAPDIVTNPTDIVLVLDRSGSLSGPPFADMKAGAARTIIYCIGLIGSDGLDIAALNNWATDPDASHVAVTPDAAELEDLFAELAANISKPGATDVLILETLDADFELGEVEPPDKGSVIVTGPRSLRWSIDSLGTTKSESAALRFAVRHTGDATGSLHVNESIEYSDAEGNLARFPDPEVYVDCGSDVYPEPCPEPRELILPSCTDSAEFDLGEFFVSPTGRIVELELSLCSVCPHRRIALAVQLYDGEEGGFSSLKTFELPAHCGPGCRDLRIRGIRFAVPDGACQCSRRALRARVLANYMDTDFNCADE